MAPGGSPPSRAVARGRSRLEWFGLEVGIGIVLLAVAVGLVVEVGMVAPRVELVEAPPQPQDGVVDGLGALDQRLELEGRVPLDVGDAGDRIVLKQELEELDTVLAGDASRLERARHVD